MASAWKLRARCPKGFGVAAGQVLTLTLPKGAESSLSELRDEAATHAKVARDRLCLKSGFPPKVILQTPPGPDEGSVTLGETVLQNRDVVMLERSEAAGAAEVGALVQVSSVQSGAPSLLLCSHHWAGRACCAARHLHGSAAAARACRTCAGSVNHCCGPFRAARRPRQRQSRRARLPRNGSRAPRPPAPARRRAKANGRGPKSSGARASLSATAPNRSPTLRAPRRLGHTKSAGWTTPLQARA